LTAAAVQPGLFPETEAERVQRIDAEILALLMGKPGGKFGETLKPKENAVLSAVRFRRGHANTVTIREISRQTGLGERAVKDAAQSLRLSFRVPIAASKLGLRGGYFIAITEQDLNIMIANIRDQVRTEIDVMKVFIGERAALDIIDALRAGMSA